MKKDSYLLTLKIIDFLVSHQKKVLIDEVIGEKYQLSQYSSPLEICKSKAQCAIVLGGDGTILSSARELAASNLPILGVNLGHLGFLAEVEARDIFDTLIEIDRGDYLIDERIMLQTYLIEKGLTHDLGLALNDVVATRASISRIVGYNLFLDQALINQYRADGIIISTPTGSTAYNLSAGGPILSPDNESMIITPICSHSLTARSIVIPSKNKICITFDDERRSFDEDLKITIDGQEVFSINPNTKIEITGSDIKAKLIKRTGNDFFGLLRKKLESK